MKVVFNTLTWFFVFFFFKWRYFVKSKINGWFNAMWNF